MKTIFFTLVSLFLTLSVSAQIKVGDNPTVIDDGSILEVESTTGAFIPPRMTTVQMNAITTPLDGALVYNTDMNCLYSFINSTWTSLCNQSTTGEITHSVRTADFNGWYLLDGRAISSLPANAQTAATALGLSGNLPDASGRFLKTKNNDSETLLATGGQNSATLTQANLPNVNFTGSTSSGGSHTHSGSTNTTGNHSHSYTDRGHSTFNTDGGSGNPLADDTSGSYTTGTSGNHSHTLTINSAGSHSHTVTVASGGSSSAINNQPNYLVVNTFIYLGQ